MPESKVKGQGHQGQKHTVHSHHPRRRRNGTRSLQITSFSSRREHSVAAGGDFDGLRAVYVWQTIFSCSFTCKCKFIFLNFCYKVQVIFRSSATYSPPSTTQRMVCHPSRFCRNVLFSVPSVGFCRS